MGANMKSGGRVRERLANSAKRSLVPQALLGELCGCPSRSLRSKAFAFFMLMIPIAGQAAAQTVTWQPPKLVNGSPVLFQMSARTGVRSITATWFSHPVTFFRSGSSRTWYALAGVPVETTPGRYPLKLREVLLGEKSVELVRMIRIGRAVYPKITVQVAKKFTEPNPEELRQINADKEVKQKVFATETAAKLWSGDFAPPVSSAISDVFGTARVFNEEVQSRHLGLDFAAPAGTPVHAVNRGTVILARPLYFEGGFIVIDHGQGLMSLYLHLSEFKVKEGDEVDTGQLIALSGGSGRATGPHLHLAIRWQGVYVNPAILLKLKIPGKNPIETSEAGASLIP
jgi:murein DD-endopeptidase MepM/ murein hydrolase activator NlpD